MDSEASSLPGRWRWTILYFAGLVGLILLASVGFKQEWIRFLQERGGDKVVHFVVMGGFAWLLTRSLRYRRIYLGRLWIYLGTLITIPLFALEEFSQRYIPLRNYDLYDLVATIAGVIVFGEILPRWYARRKRRRYEASVS